MLLTNKVFRKWVFYPGTESETETLISVLDGTESEFHISDLDGRKCRKNPTMYQASYKNLTLNGWINALLDAKLMNNDCISKRTVWMGTPSLHPKYSKNLLRNELWSHVFRCASHLYEGVSVCWSIGQLVRGSIGPSSFRKIVKNGQNLLKKNMKRIWEDNLDIFTPSGAN